ncbi:MAG: hypothetical protein ACLUKN_04170 [Bacilli bacterium]
MGLKILCCRLLPISDGDIRRALNALETIVLAHGGGGTLSSSDVEIFAKERWIRYDRREDEHYNTVSAFIKSVGMRSRRLLCIGSQKCSLAARIRVL